MQLNEMLKLITHLQKQNKDLEDANRRLQTF